MLKKFQEFRSEFTRSWQASMNYLPDWVLAVNKVIFYCLSGWYALLAIGAPFSEYVFVGKHNFYKLWQKMIFSVAAASVSVGCYRLAGTYRRS